MKMYQYNKYVSAIPMHEHHQNQVDWRFSQLDKKYGVSIAERYSDNDYFDPETVMFPTRAMAYNYAKRCEKCGDKIIGFIGF